MPAFQPLTRQSLADGVFDQLVDGIVTGDLPSGEALPSERALADAFGVSRPAVREALKRLAQAGMVAIRQGDATTVRPWRRTAGPELLTRLLVHADGTVDLHVARSVLEVRQAVGPDIAALASRRAPADLAQRLHDPLERLTNEQDAVALQRAALDFWDVLVDAGDNVAFRLMFNALATAYEPVMEGLAEVMRVEVSDAAAYRRVADAVLAGEDDRARDAARDLLAAGTGAVLSAIEPLLAEPQAALSVAGVPGASDPIDPGPNDPDPHGPAPADDRGSDR